MVFLTGKIFLFLTSFNYLQMPLFGVSWHHLEML
ncbi:Uncharacterised protein [Mycobacterium tuberculosis]|nr:Uncharacterised protein [Mycobacterium tuberculosis]